MRRILLPLALIFQTHFASAADDFFRLPSFVSAQGGVGKDQYTDAAISLGLSLPGNWQLEAGFDRTATLASDDSGNEIVTKGYRLGGGSDPLNLFSFRLLAEGWELENVQSRGGRIGVTWAPGLWTISLDFIGQELSLTNLPLLVQRDGEETIKDSGFSLRVSTIAVRKWNFFLGGQVHRYDRDLSRLYEIPTLILSRVPATVLTTLTGLNKSDAYLGATYMFKRWDLGFEAGRSISIVDNVKTRRFGINGMYYPNRRWSFGLGVMTFKPEDAEESGDATHSSTAVVTYKW